VCCTNMQKCVKEKKNKIIVPVQTKSFFVGGVSAS